MGEPTTAEKMRVLLQPELVAAAKEYLLMHPERWLLDQLLSGRGQVSDGSTELLAVIARSYGVSQRSLRLAIRVVRSMEQPHA